MKKFRFLIAAAMFMTLSAATAHAAEISIVVNGEKIETQTPAVIVYDRTMVPLRAVSESLGCDVSWDADTRGITLTDGNSLYFTWIDHDYVFKTSATALEEATALEAVPVIMNDYTMVPLRAISEMFGAQVGWDGSTSTVSVSYPKKTVTNGLAEKFRAYERSLYQKYDAYKSYAKGEASVIKAEIQLEAGGTIGLELYPELAPATVDNFVKLVNNKFYDGLIFHRVIPGFMIQGGGFDTSMVQRNADTISGEFISNGYFNLIPHSRGVLSMARTTVPDSASSQFFIMHADSPSLNGEYAAFGKVTSGMEYVDKIAATQTASRTDLGMDDVPVENQVIKTIVIK